MGSNALLSRRRIQTPVKPQVHRTAIGISMLIWIPWLMKVLRLFRRRHFRPHRWCPCPTFQIYQLPTSWTTNVTRLLSAIRKTIPKALCYRLKKHVLKKQLLRPQLSMRHCYHHKPDKKRDVERNGTNSVNDRPWRMHPRGG